MSIWWVLTILKQVEEKICHKYRARTAFTERWWRLHKGFATSIGPGQHLGSPGGYFRKALSPVQSPQSSGDDYRKALPPVQCQASLRVLAIIERHCHQYSARTGLRVLMMGIEGLCVRVRCQSLYCQPLSSTSLSLKGFQLYVGLEI